MTPRVGLTKLQIGESGLGSVYTTINDPTRGDSHSTPLTVAVKILKQLSQQVCIALVMQMIAFELCPRMLPKRKLCQRKNVRPSILLILCL